MKNELKGVIRMIEDDRIPQRKDLKRAADLRKKGETLLLSLKANEILNITSIKLFQREYYKYFSTSPTKYKTLYNKLSNELAACVNKVGGKDIFVKNVLEAMKKKYNWQNISRYCFLYILEVSYLVLKPPLWFSTTNISKRQRKMLTVNAIQGFKETFPNINKNALMAHMFPVKEILDRYLSVKYQFCKSIRSEEVIDLNDHQYLTSSVNEAEMTSIFGNKTRKRRYATKNLLRQAKKQQKELVEVVGEDPLDKIILKQKLTPSKRKVRTKNAINVESALDFSKVDDTSSEYSAATDFSRSSEETPSVANEQFEPEESIINPEQVKEMETRLRIDNSPTDKHAQTMRDFTQDSFSVLSTTPKKKRKKPIPWSLDEVNNLKDGIYNFGEGKWAAIFAAYQFHHTRDSGSLKDKWRNIKNKQAREAAMG